MVDYRWTEWDCCFLLNGLPDYLVIIEQSLPSLQHWLSRRRGPADSAQGKLCASVRRATRRIFKSLKFITFGQPARHCSRTGEPGRLFLAIRLFGNSIQTWRRRSTEMTTIRDDGDNDLWSVSFCLIYLILLCPGDFCVPCAVLAERERTGQDLVNTLPAIRTGQPY